MKLKSTFAILDVMKGRKELFKLRFDSQYRDPNNHYVPAAREFLLARQSAE